MDILENKKIALLKDKINLIRTNAHKKGRFSLFDTKFSIDFFSKDLEYKKLEYFYELIEEWDEVCNLPYNVGVSLDKLSSNNTVMFHRTNLGLNKGKVGLEYNDTLLNVMKEGLKNYGHANAIGGSAFINTPPSLTLTMTPLEGLTGYINLVSSYKSNDVIILSAFPKRIVNDNGQLVNESNYSDIYDFSSDTTRVKKEYMIGVILKKDPGLDEFYTRDEVINKLGNNLKSSNIK